MVAVVALVVIVAVVDVATSGHRRTQTGAINPEIKK